jgi:hypothetical protein
MATENSTATLAGNFKQIYGDNILDLIPTLTRITKMLDFQYAEALGDQFNQPVDLSQEHGVTYAAANTENIVLLDPTAGQMANALVNGSQIYARSRVNYEAMVKANAAGQKAFAKATAHIVKRLTNAAGKRLEAMMLHGRRGWGSLSSVSGSSTTRAWVLTEASWAAGLWAGAKNMTLDVFAADYTGSKVNSNAKVVVVSVDIDNRTLNVSGNATDLTAITAGMHLFPETASPSTECAGIDAIIRNTGTLFNISASDYELWKGHVVSSVGRPTMAGFLGGVRRAVELGLVEDVTAIVSPKCFEVLNDDVAALRRQDSSYSTKEGVNGVEEIKYHGQSGVLTIMPHLFQKDGQAHIIAPSEWRRIGATDLTFISRGANGEDKLVLELPNSPAAEMRCMFHGAVFCEAPARSVVLTGISYT